MSHPRVNRSLRRIPLLFKLLYLVVGAGLFFILFPFIVQVGMPVYIGFITLLVIFGIGFRLTTDQRTFRITIWLWATGSVIYLVIAGFLIVKGIQPLSYVYMKRFDLILYYLSYPLRVLGIFFTGLTFVAVTSPVEFLKMRRGGLMIALIYRAFEYSIASFNDNRIALLIQGNWPDKADKTGKIILFIKLIRFAPILITITFRNLILWSPWAWICYNSIKKEILGRYVR